MRTNLVSTCCAVIAAAALMITACATQKAAPDIAEVEAQIAASKAEEVDLVRSTIAESQRADKFIGLLAERDRILNSIRAEVTAHKERMAALNANYSAERSDFEASLSEYNRTRTGLQQDLVDLISEMKRTTSADEWNEIADFQLQRLDPRRLAYRGLAGGN